MDQLIAPAVYLDFHKRTCIAVKVTVRHVYYIPMDSEGLELVEASHDRFSSAWRQCDYAPITAAARYLASAEIIPQTVVVTKLLKQILSAASGAPAAEMLDLPDAPITKETEMAIAKKKTTAAKKPAAKKPAAKKPAAKKPVAEKPAAKKPVAEKPVAEKKVRKPGVTALIMAELKKGAEKEEILMAIRDQFPDSKAGTAEISWCRSYLKKSGG